MANVTVIPNWTSIKAPMDQTIQIGFNDGQIIVFGFEHEKLFFLPDIPTCALYMFDWMLLNQHGFCANSDGGSIEIGNFYVGFNIPQLQFETMWIKGDPPAEFLPFQEEFNKLRDRLLKLKAFW